MSGFFQFPIYAHGSFIGIDQYQQPFYNYNYNYNASPNLSVIFYQQYYGLPNMINQDLGMFYGYDQNAYYNQQQNQYYAYNTSLSKALKKQQKYAQNNEYQYPVAGYNNNNNANNNNNQDAYYGLNRSYSAPYDDYYNYNYNYNNVQYEQPQQVNAYYTNVQQYYPQVPVQKQQYYYDQSLMVPSINKTPIYQTIPIVPQQPPQIYAKVQKSVSNDSSLQSLLQAKSFEELEVKGKLKNPNQIKDPYVRFTYEKLLKELYEKQQELNNEKEKSSIPQSFRVHDKPLYSNNFEMRYHGAAAVVSPQQNKNKQKPVFIPPDPEKLLRPTLRGMPSSYAKFSKISEQTDIKSEVQRLTEEVESIEKKLKLLKSNDVEKEADKDEVESNGNEDDNESDNESSNQSSDDNNDDIDEDEVISSVSNEKDNVSNQDDDEANNEEVVNNNKLSKQPKYVYEYSEQLINVTNPYSSHLAIDPYINDVDYIDITNLQYPQGHPQPQQQRYHHRHHHHHNRYHQYQNNYPGYYYQPQQVQLNPYLQQSWNNPQVFDYYASPIYTVPLNLDGDKRNKHSDHRKSSKNLKNLNNQKPDPKKVFGPSERTIQAEQTKTKQEPKNVGNPVTKKHYNSDRGSVTGSIFDVPLPSDNISEYSAFVNNVFSKALDK